MKLGSNDINDTKRQAPHGTRGFTESDPLPIFYMHYNFVRIHQTLRVTPAMAAGVTDRLWAIEDLIALL